MQRRKSVMNQLRKMQNARLSASLMGVGSVLLLLALVLATPAAAQRDPLPTPTPLPLYALPDARLIRSVSSNTIALAGDNRTLAAANMLNDTISMVVPGQGRLLAEIPVGDDPRSLAFFENDTKLVVTNRGDNSLSIVELETQRVTSIRLQGVWPYGVVVDGMTAYVSLQGSDQIAVVDLAAEEVVNYIPVADAPTGLTLWGDFLYVAHFWSGEISLVYLPQSRTVTTVSTGIDTGLFQSIELDITRGLAYLPQTRSNASNPALTYDTTVFPIVNVIDFRGMTVDRNRRITLDTVDRPVNTPFAAALDRFRNWLFVANAGSNNISVIDLNNGQIRAHIDVGANPRGILLNQGNTALFVHNTLEGTLTIIDVPSLEIFDELPISDFNIPIDTLLAQQLFYTAADPRMSANNWISCGNCHFDGMSDGRVWQGFSGGRNTPVLYDLLNTPPYNWSGTWDELADVEIKIRGLQAGRGLIQDGTLYPPLGDPHTGLSLDLDVLASYLGTISGPVNPVSPDEELVERGRAVFEEQGCATCHIGDIGLDEQLHDVGTGGEFDTPSLRWLWTSAPYFHDGSAATLYNVFIDSGEVHDLIKTISMDDLDALVAYLLTLPNSS